MQQRLVEIFLLQEAGPLGNNIEKEPQNSQPKLKKISIYREYFLYLQPNVNGSFGKNVLIL